MNEGLFGISAGTASAASSKVRVRAPFTATEISKNALRLQAFPIGPLSRATAVGTGQVWPYILATNGSIVVGLGTTSSAAATTVAVSSTDGIFWSTRTVTSGIYSDCIWTGTIFFAITTATTATQTSSDGITWAVGTVRPNSALSVLRVFNGKVYIFPNAGTTYYESTDLNCTAWVTKTSPANYAAPGGVVTVTGSRIVISTSATAGASSLDGSTWTTWSIPTLVGSSTNRFLVGNATVCTLLVYTNIGNGTSVWMFISNNGGLSFSQTARVLDLRSVAPESTSAAAANGAEGTGPSSVGAPSLSIERVTTVNSGQRMAAVVHAGHNSGIRSHLIHSVDGITWTAETQFANSTNNADGGVIGFNSGFVLTYGLARSNAASPSSVSIITNSTFQELVYDL